VQFVRKTECGPNVCSIQLTQYDYEFGNKSKRGSIMGNRMYVEGGREGVFPFGAIQNKVKPQQTETK